MVIKSKGLEQWDKTLASMGVDERRMLERRVSQIQVHWRYRLQKQRIQGEEVQKLVKDLQASRNLSNEHIVDDRKLDICCDLPTLTLDSAASALNAQAPHKKTALMKSLGGAVQLLFRALQGVTKLAAQATIHSLSEAVQILLVDLFHCNNAVLYRIVHRGSGRGSLLELGKELYVPVSTLPLAAKLLGKEAWSPVGPEGDESRAERPDSCSVAVSTVSSNELSHLKVMAWMEPADAAGMGKPEAIVAAGEKGAGILDRALEEEKRDGVEIRNATKEDACHVMALRIGGESASGPEAIVLMNRGETFTPDECFVASWIGAHIANALGDTTTRLRLRDFRQSKARLLEAVRDMNSDEKAVERIGRDLIGCEDAMMFLVSPQQESGRPELVPLSRDVRLEERDGIYEYVEHLSTKGRVLNIRQGQAGALEHQLGLLPKGLRGQGRSMLCVPIVAPTNIDSSIPEGVIAMMQWRNAPKGEFTASDCRLAIEWASVASPALQLAFTQGQRKLLEERVQLASAKRDALLATSKILGSQRNIGELFTFIMEHAKSLMEVERSTMFLVDQERGVLRTMVADGLGAMGEITVPGDKGLVGACVRAKRLINIRNAYDDHRFNKEIDLATGFRTRSVLCYPIMNASEDVIGVIQLINKVGDSSSLPFTENDEDLLSAFAGQIGIALVNLTNASNLKRELQLSRDSLLTFEHLTRRLANCGTLPSLSLLIRELEKVLVESTGAHFTHVYLNSPEGVLKAELADKKDPAPSRDLQEEAKRAKTAYVKAQHSREADAHMAGAAMVQRSEVGEGSNARHVLSVVVVMPPFESIAAFRADRGQNGETKSTSPVAIQRGRARERQLDSDETDEIVFEDGSKQPEFVPGDVLGVIQLFGKRHSLANPAAGPLEGEPTPLSDDAPDRLPRQASFGGAAEAADEAASKQVPLFTAEDESALCAVARAFSTLLPAVRIREVRESRALLAESVIASSRQTALLVQRFVQVGSGASSIEDLFPVARSFTTALPCVACHLFLIRNDQNAEDSAISSTVQELWSLPELQDTSSVKSDSLEHALTTGAANIRGPRRVKVQLGSGILGACAVDAKPLLVHHAITDQRFESWVDEAVQPLPATRAGTAGASIACVPLIDLSGSVVGVLQAFGSKEIPLGKTQVEKMVLLAHLLCVNLQMLQANGKPASEQVIMQRAMADLQRDAREVREEYLKYRRAMFEKLELPAKQMADAVTETEEALLRQPELTRSKSSAGAVVLTREPGPSATIRQESCCTTTLPLAMAASEASLPRDRKLEAQQSANLVLKPSASLPAVGRPGMNVVKGSSSALPLPSPVIPIREPKQVADDIMDAAGHESNIMPTRRSRYLISKVDLKNASKKTPAYALKPRALIEAPLPQLDAEHPSDAVDSADPHANPYIRAGPRHPALDPNRSVATLNYKAQPQLQRQRPKTVASHLHGKDEESSELPLQSAPTNPEVPLTEKRERQPAPSLGLRRKAFGGVGSTTRQSTESEATKPVLADKPVLPTERTLSAIDISTIDRPSAPMSNDAAKSKMVGAVDVFWNDLLRTVRDL